MNTWRSTSGGEQGSWPEGDGRSSSHNGHSEEHSREERSALEPSKANGRSAVLLDQHPLWLEAMEQVLARHGMQVVGKATSPEEALQVVTQTRPYAFIAEIGLQYPAMDGVTCLREVRKAMPSLRIIVLSAVEDPALIEAAFAAGTLAYIVKKAHPDDVGAAIRQTFDLSIFFAQDYAGAPQRPQPVEAEASSPNGRAEVPAAYGLTRRELEILQIVAEGYSNGQLARMLWVTEQTVKFHLSNIYRKLDVANRTEASRWAQTHNLLPETPKAAESA
jgi:DNA-binding NarL/FixJ family response regulator